MKVPPSNHDEPTEAIFVVVRSVLGDYVRNAMYHLDFVAPHLKPIARDYKSPIPESGEIVKLEAMVEEKYLQACDPENPLHFMTIWKARGHLASFRFLENYSKCLKVDTPQDRIQLDSASFFALRMLECDTSIMASPLTKGFRWMLQYHFPLPAYIHLIKELEKRPFNEHAHKAWETMSDNFEARFYEPHHRHGVFYKFFTQLIIHGWEIQEAAAAQLGETSIPPRIVMQLRSTPGQDAQTLQEELEHESRSSNLSTAIPPNSQGHNALPNLNPQSSYNEICQGAWEQYVTGRAPQNTNINPFDWPTMDWGIEHPTW